MAEYGRYPAAPAALTDFYDNSTGLPASGAISLGNFYGKSFETAKGFPVKDFTLVYQDGREVRVSNTVNTGTALAATGNVYLLRARANASTQASYPNSFQVQDVTGGVLGNSMRHQSLVVYFTPYAANNLDFAWRPDKTGNNAIQVYNWYLSGTGGHYVGYEIDRLRIKQGTSEYWYFKVPK